LVIYPALFEPDEKAGGFVVTFPDLPHGVTQGETVEEAIEMATDLLACLITDVMEKGEALPAPSKPRGRKYRPINLPALQSAKAELYRAFVASGMRKADLARRLGIPKTTVDRLFDFGNHTRLDQIEAAFAALGKRLSIAVEDTVYAPAA
jgi:antitoxin HicB